MVGFLSSSVHSLQSEAGKEFVWHSKNVSSVGVRSPSSLFKSPRSGVTVRSSADTDAEAEQQFKLQDPETKYRRYGRHFGKRYVLDINDLLDRAPRVRIRSTVDRQRDQLADLAVVNERLAGNQAWQIRKKLEYMKVKRKNWEMIYNYVTRTDAAATLDMIEEAYQKVEQAVSEEAREMMSVNDLKTQLVELQEQVGKAQQKLQRTENKVKLNLQQVEELKSEMASLERISASSSASPSNETPLTQPTTRVIEFEVPSIAQQPSSSRSTQSTMPSSTATTATNSDHRRRRGLYSSLELEDELRNFWYPTAFSKDLCEGKMIPFELFGETWVMFRDETGAAAAVRDECAHRACPLSLGQVVDGQIACPYHGWQYNGAGDCTLMPSTAFCKGISVTALPCQEKDGFVWVWPGDERVPSVPSFAEPPSGYVVHAELEVEVPVEHGLLMENLLDLAHAPFTHTSTFAKGWPVPDMVKFHTNRLLGGFWEPYPITMAFQPPCMVLSTIGLAQPGKIMRNLTADQCANHLHQLHVCLPSRAGHTRLLYRMSMDFMQWAVYVPGIQRFWEYIAGQVLGEDLVLVKGQQERMMAGGDTWQHPVSYDKLAVRYRRWRNSLGDDEATAALLSEQQSQQHMTAGQMMSLDDPADT